MGVLAGAAAQPRVSTLTWSMVATLNSQGLLLPASTLAFTATSLSSYAYADWASVGVRVLGLTDRGAVGWLIRGPGRRDAACSRATSTSLPPTFVPTTAGYAAVAGRWERARRLDAAAKLTLARVPRWSPARGGPGLDVYQALVQHELRELHGQRY